MIREVDSVIDDGKICVITQNQKTPMQNNHTLFLKVKQNF